MHGWQPSAIRPKSCRGHQWCHPAVRLKLLNDIESGEIPRETWVEAIVYGLKDELEERLEQYDQTKTRRTP